MTFATVLMRVVRAAWERSLAFQPEILPMIFCFKSTKAKLLFLWKKRGRPRCFAFEGIWRRFRIVRMEETVVGVQFLLRKMEDLDILTF